MKILKLKFKNLNSLENEHSIDFETAPFSETGVFAITGPNGSGKSTILDAITLGLYGETFRFNRPAGHVMTKHATDCYAEIEFSSGRDKFRSSWHAQRAADDPAGELLPSEMKLIHLNGGEALLAQTPAQVCAKITDITGMNFRSFTRSILLAQGDFAAFLNALDNERLDILEKIISTDIYADYRKEIIDKADKAQQMLTFLQQDLSVIPLLDPVKREACEHDLIDFQEQYAELQQQHDALKRQQTALSRFEALQSQVAEQETSLKTVQEQIEAEQGKLDRLEAGQSALNFKDDLQILTASNHGIQQGKETLSAFRNELKQLQDRIASVSGGQPAPADSANRSFAEQQQAITAIRTQVNVLGSNRHAAQQLWQSLGQQIREKTALRETADAWLQEHAADQALLDHFPEIDRWKKLNNELAALTEQQKNFSKWSAKISSTQKSNTLVIGKNRKKQAELQKMLSAEQTEFEALAQGKTFAEIQDVYHHQQERVASVRDLIKLADAHQTLDNNTGFFGFFRKEEPALDAEALTLDLENLRQEIKREENIQLALDELAFREMLSSKMAADRFHLVDGKPCPLCGSLEHPYAKNPPATVNAHQAQADQQIKIKKLKAQVETTERHIVLAKKQAEINQAKQNRLLQIRSQWLTLCNRLNLASKELDINNRVLMKQLLKNEIVELTHIASLISKYQRKQKSIEKLTAKLAKTGTTVEHLQSTSEQIDSEWQAKSEQQTALEAALANCRQDENELSEQVRRQLEALGETLPAGGKESVLIERLTARRNEYQTHLFRRNALDEDLAGLTDKQTACQAEITACDSQLTVFNSQLQTEETTGLHLALVEKQKLIADQEQTLVRLEVETGKQRQQLQEKLHGTEFTSIDQVSDMLKLLQQRPELEQRKIELDQQAHSKAQALEHSRAQLATERNQGLAELTPAELNAQLRGIGEKKDIAYQEALRLETLLKDQDRLQQKYSAIAAQLDDQEKLVRQCLEEKALLDPENGMAFRRRVQSRIVDQLLAQTNAILEKISGRYYLRQTPSEQGLALEIEDTYQGNARRVPKTLSGGESFVVSLALALGLSELVNNGKSVDSLFLDEGFGNLDAENLYTVISTLENLHTQHGKTVGVISHVEAVQKRFKVQLQVVKKPNGMGMLKKAS